MFSRQHRHLSILILLSLLLAVPAAAEEQSSAEKIRESVAAFLAPVGGDGRDFSWRVQGWKAGGSAEEPKLDIAFARKGSDGFLLWVKSEPVTFLLRRDKAKTDLFLPRQNRHFLADGPLGKDSLGKDTESLAPFGFLARILGPNSQAPTLAKLWVLARLAAAKSSPEGGLMLDDKIRIRLAVDGSLRLSSSARRGFFEGIAELRLTQEPFGAPELKGETEKVNRHEMERMFFRAMKRFLEIYVPALAPVERLRARKVPHGELRFVKGQRLVLLEGNPEEIGTAHGQLLGPLIERTLDSYVYLVGAVETLRTGKWFLDEMEKAWFRLSPHMLARHRRELRAMAAAVPGLSLREIRLANVLPEYFHCSGFAVFGKATKGGELFHGRILDYMTAIGLQQAAALFYIRPEDGHDFAHVGYAGFIGTVTGMNGAGISLGEMGGAGRYQWNGVPMASLMRQALEECDNLDEIKALWARSPRTCEYYYVFADANGPTAVGVKATPDILEFIEPGQDHERLGKGMTDVVVMSSGSRLATLRARIMQSYGKIDREKALRLMDRPVAMRSNLHSALMLPQSREIYVAHAGDGKPAAERPYVRFDLAVLHEQADREGIGSGGRARTIRVTESRRRTAEPDEARQKMLASMLWDTRPFRLKIEETPGSKKGDALLRFPSPLPMGDAVNDEVVVEWYRPKESKAKNGKKPALLCLHILGGNMELTRTVARAARLRGMHAFLLQMPGYGRRRGKWSRRDMRYFQHRLRQAAADVQRAQDSIASLDGIDADRVYLQGTSLGGIVGALSASLADDFAGQFFMLAGGGLKDMLRDGKRDSKKILDAFHRGGIRGAALDKILDSVDPARLAHRLDPSKTWLYSAVSDTVVPPKQARLLAARASLATDHHIWVAGGHYTAILTLPWILDHMFEQIESSSARH